MNCCPHRRCRKLARRKEATAGQPLSIQAAQLLSPVYFYATSCHILSSSKFTWWLTQKLIALRSRFGSRKLRCASYPAGSTRQPCSPLHMSHRERDTERQQEEDAKRCAARIAAGSTRKRRFPTSRTPLRSQCSRATNCATTAYNAYAAVQQPIRGNSFFDDKGITAGDE